MLGNDGGMNSRIQHTMPFYLNGIDGVLNGFLNLAFIPKMVIPIYLDKVL